MQLQLCVKRREVCCRHCCRGEHNEQLARVMITGAARAHTCHFCHLRCGCAARGAPCRVELDQAQLGRKCCAVQGWPGWRGLA